MAIVGMGPRGLTVLERLVANQRAQKSGTIQFDPNSPGTGCHDTDQAAHLLVNTLAGQSIWTDFVILSNGHTKVAARNARNPTSTGTLVYEQRDC